MLAHPRILMDNEVLPACRENYPMSIEQVTAVLSDHPDIKLAFVFGSLASNTQHRDSDVDVAVQKSAALGIEEKLQLIGELALATGRAVDLVDLREVGEPLLGQILKHGRQIRGDATDRALLMQRHVYAMEDFMPYVERTLAERRKAWIG